MANPEYPNTRVLEDPSTLHLKALSPEKKYGGGYPLSLCPEEASFIWHYTLPTPQDYVGPFNWYWPRPPWPRLVPWVPAISESRCCIDKETEAINYWELHSSMLQSWESNTWLQDLWSYLLPCLYHLLFSNDQQGFALPSPPPLSGVTNPLLYLCSQTLPSTLDPLWS